MIKILNLSNSVLKASTDEDEKNNGSTLMWGLND